MKKSDPNEYDELNPLLPLTITAIQVQKKNKERFSLYHENRFLLGVSTQTLVSCSLKKGTLLTFKKLDSILAIEQYSKAKEYTLGILSRRDHSVQELIIKGIKKGFNKDVLERVTHELRKNNYLDDHRFASNFIHDAIEFKKWSLNKIKFELRKKGVNKSIISELFNGFDEAIWKEQMYCLVRKNRAKFIRSDSTKRKKKMYDYLARKGYSSTLIWSEMNKLLSLVETE
jgi:regulatory protein